MDDGSTSVALPERARKRTISAHLHSTSTDSHARTSLMKTKIQRIDGQYKATTTTACPLVNDSKQTNSSDDQDEPLIVATYSPLIKNRSKYRTRPDIYDDETGDDQKSNASSLDSPPSHESVRPLPVPSSVEPALASTHDSTQFNKQTNETSVDMSTPVARLAGEGSIQEKPLPLDESLPARITTPKKSHPNRSSDSSSAISTEPTKSR